MSALVKAAVSFVLLALCASSGAAQVYMVATGPLAIDNTTYRAVEGATYDVQIWMDFTGDQTLGGGYDVVFNEYAFDFVSWTSGSIGDPQYERMPDVFDGLLESAGVADFAGMFGPGIMAIATFTLVDVAALGPMTTAATGGIAGHWQSAVDFICCQNVDYSGLQFVVPVPAAFWLLGGGLIALSGFSARVQDR